MKGGDDLLALIVRGHDLPFQTEQGVPEDLLATQLSPPTHHGENTATAVLGWFAVLSQKSKLVVSTILFSTWMSLLLFGWTFGGAVYLLLLACLVLFPWKALKA